MINKNKKHKSRRPKSRHGSPSDYLSRMSTIPINSAINTLNLNSLQSNNVMQAANLSSLHSVQNFQKLQNSSTLFSQDTTLQMLQGIGANSQGRAENVDTLNFGHIASGSPQMQNAPLRYTSQPSLTHSQQGGYIPGPNAEEHSDELPIYEEIETYHLSPTKTPTTSSHTIIRSHLAHTTQQISDAVSEVMAASESVSTPTPATAVAANADTSELASPSPLKSPSQPIQQPSPPQPVQHPDSQQQQVPAPPTRTDLRRQQIALQSAVGNSPSLSAQLALYSSLSAFSARGTNIFMPHSPHKKNRSSPNLAVDSTLPAFSLSESESPDQHQQPEPVPTVKAETESPTVDVETQISGFVCRLEDQLKRKMAGARLEVQVVNQLKANRSALEAKLQRLETVVNRHPDSPSFAEISRVLKATGRQKPQTEEPKSV